MNLKADNHQYACKKDSSDMMSKERVLLERGKNELVNCISISNAKFKACCFFCFVLVLFT